MRTLTKERVNLSGLANNSGVLSVDLISDGPNEVICRKLSILQETSKKALIMSKQVSVAKADQSRRRNYAKVFISRYTKMFGISHESMKDLVKELKDEDIVLLENSVLERLRKPAILQMVGSFGAIATFIGSGLGFLFGSQALGFLAFIMFITTTGWLLPFMILTDCFYGWLGNGCGDFSPGGYFGARRTFKKKYGPKYFPYQELKEELGLVEKQGIDSYYAPKVFNH